jgi:hypothetical protein
MNSQPDPGHTGNFGLAWLFLCVAFCAHVADEALTGFLDVYNPTVLAVRAQHPWFTMPTFKFREWFIGLIVANAVFLLLTARISKGALAAPARLLVRLRNAAERPGPHRGNDLRTYKSLQFTSADPPPAFTPRHCFSQLRSISCFA